jgi:uncharacterized protein (TIGR02284 family)
MNKKKSIVLLNSLIEINNDRIEEYEIDANETEESDLKILFFQFQQTSQKCKAELIIEVQRLGGVPTQNAKIGDSFFKVWMNVIAILTGKNRNSILNSCKYSDDIAVNSYSETLKTKRRYITHEQQIMLKSQHSLIKADNNKVKELLANTLCS